MNSSRTRVNDEIRASKVRLIDADGNQLGVVSLEEALSQAQTADLDLVEVAPDANPPVARIIDWGKYQYEKIKQAQKARKKSKSQDLKQVRFTLKIGDHDFNIKVKKIRQFLEKGHKVRVGVFFRGREIIHPELGHKLLERVMTELDDIAVVDTKAVITGKHLNMTIRKK